MIKTFLLICCCFCVIGFSKSLYFKPIFVTSKNSNSKSPTPIPNSNYVYKTEYIHVKIDHFGWAESGKFPLRYLVNDQYWDKKNGPLFFYTGNEGDIETFANNTGFMWDIAPKFKAMIVFAEHRYYGKSMPFGKDSYKTRANLNYFTSEQALADYADLIQMLRGHHEAPLPVVAFGGSYGGMLAAWFRMKYPHIVSGAIAASAPIWQFPGLTQCNVYNKIVTDDFRKANANCAINIRKSWAAFDEIGKTDSGRKYLTDTFKVCKPLKTVNNVTSLKALLANMYGEAAMVDYPYPASFLQPLPAWPVKAICAHLGQKVADSKTLLQNIANAAFVWFNYTGQAKCVDYDSDPAASMDANGWDYQACTEMVMPMCSDGKTDMFEPVPWNYDAFLHECLKTWGVKPTKNWVTRYYGDKNIKAASNIVFSNGELDPWSGGGVLKNISSTLQAVIIANGAHHLDLRGHDPADPPSVLAARNIHMKAIDKWLTEEKLERNEL